MQHCEWVTLPELLFPEKQWNTDTVTQLLGSSWFVPCQSATCSEEAFTCSHRNVLNLLLISKKIKTQNLKTASPSWLIPWCLISLMPVIRMSVHWGMNQYYLVSNKNQAIKHLDSRNRGNHTALTGSSWECYWFFGTSLSCQNFCSVEPSSLKIYFLKTSQFSQL